MFGMRRALCIVAPTLAHAFHAAPMATLPSLTGAAAPVVRRYATFEQHKRPLMSAADGKYTIFYFTACEAFWGRALGVVLTLDAGGKKLGEDCVLSGISSLLRSVPRDSALVMHR
eukprot:6267560-Prymnesium_polylepis.1